MIRVTKDPTAPLSLSTTSAYDGQDVQFQLEHDHQEKCYLCERVLYTDFQVEHLKSQENYPALKQDWNNLFWACGYCNGKKGSRFDNLLDPTSVNIEDEIKQTIDFNQKQASFTPLITTESHKATCNLLTNIHNGTGNIRKLREENCFEYVMGVVNDFYRLVSQYLNAQNNENRELVREELQIDKECLGFKYWIIKGHPRLSTVFANDIVWNKK